MNEIKEHQAINEALLRNVKARSPQGKPNHSTNRFKKEFCHKEGCSSGEEGKEEHTPEPTEGYYHTPSSDYSLSPCRKKQRNQDNLQGDFRKIKAPTYEGEMNIGEKDEE